VVLGHTKCGAIKGACDHVQLGHLSTLLAKIEPAVQQEKDTDDNRTSENPAFVEHVAENNVRKSVLEVIEGSDIIKGLINEGKLGIVGAMYDVTTGLVKFYTDTLIVNSPSGVEMTGELA
jgi:carbonic anhydrase